MRVALVAPLVAVASIATAHVARGVAKDRAKATIDDPPYAPSVGSAPFVTLGYRELGADLLFIRMVGYFGSEDNEAPTLAGLSEAIAALDPLFKRNYEFGAVAMTGAKRGVDNAVRMRAIDVLATGARAFPTVYKFPLLAGEIYIVDLKTDDPAQRRKWDEAGARLLEEATRKPGAPAEMSMAAASLRSKLGQQQRAIDSLREMLLITNDARARQRIIAQLAALADEGADEIAAEVLAARARFEAEWLSTRPALTPSMYVLVGPKPAPGFSLADLATGGRDVIGADDFERLEPLTDPTSAGGPSSP